MDGISATQREPDLQKTLVPKRVSMFKHSSVIGDVKYQSTWSGPRQLRLKPSWKNTMSMIFAEE
jgi:hypothetical protein